MRSLKDLHAKVNAAPVPAELQAYWASLPPDHFMNDIDGLLDQQRTEQARADAMVKDGGQQAVQVRFTIDFRLFSAVFRLFSAVFGLFSADLRCLFWVVLTILVFFRLALQAAGSTDRAAEGRI